MRENQRGNRPYADNTSAGMQQGRNKHENNAEANFHPMKDDAVTKSADMHIASSEGMQYLDIIPRFAL